MAQDTFDILEKVVSELKGPPNWYFRLADEDGAKRLVITLDTVSNYDNTKPFAVSHFHPVPIATYNEKTWQRWVFDQCIRTMNHELGEALSFKGKRPFAPMHGPGEDPYIVHDNRTDEERRTMQDGSVRKPKLPSIMND
jgi:hypothetical protein